MRINCSHNYMDDDTKEIVDKIKSGKLIFGLFNPFEFGGGGTNTAIFKTGKIVLISRYSDCDTWSYDVFFMENNDRTRLLVDGHAVYEAIREVQAKTRKQTLSDRQKHEMAMAKIRNL